MPQQGVEVSEIAGLVRGAAAGDRRAWERLIEQYARLIWSITADFKLAESDAADVAQTTWLRLLEHIDRIQYPDRVGSWLAATARNECLRSLAARKRVVLGHDEEILSGVVASGPAVDERILADERDQVVRDALSRLPGRWQRLLELLMADPPTSYADISDELGLPVGSIGPTRGRCLAQLRVLLQASLAEGLYVHPLVTGVIDLRAGATDFGHQARHEGQRCVRSASAGLSRVSRPSAAHSYEGRAGVLRADQPGVGGDEMKAAQAGLGDAMPTSPSPGARPGILLDRDGTIIVDHGYVGSVDRVEFIEGAPEAIAWFNRAGIPVAVVTNQAGVARGLYGIDDVDRVHSHIAKHLAELGAHIDLFVFCPYHPAGLVEAFARTSEDRKPRPGMAKAAQAALNLDLTASWVVGDRPEDLGLAEAVGASAIYLGNDGCLRPGVWSFPSLAAAAPFVLERIAV